MNNKKILSIIIFVSALIALAIGYKKLSVHLPTHNEHVKYTSEQTAPSVDQLKKQYVQEFEQEEQAIWQELAKLGLSYQKCNQLKKQNAEEYKKNVHMLYKDLCIDKKISSENYQLVSEILNDFGIDTRTITIKSLHSGLASTTDDTIYINENRLNQFSPSAKKFIVAHEIIHLLHKDDSTYYILEETLGYHTEKDHPTNKIKRFFETRADILSALNSKDYTQNTVHGLKEILNVYGDNKGISHPKTSLRLAKAQKLGATMQIQVA